MPGIRHLLVLALLALGAVASLACSAPGPAREAEAAYEALVARYIEEWKDVHPERAAALGLDEYRDRTGDRSAAAIDAWVAFNDSVLDSISRAPETLPLELRIDLRLVRDQGADERARWANAEGRDEAGAGEGAGRAFPLGRDAYAADLTRYYGMEITPEVVAERALREIETVRRLMAETAAAHWAETHADPAAAPAPADEGALIAWALEEMERNRATTQQESLELFTRFADEAEAFVGEAGIATLPAERTLDIVLTPASAGPSQRIGFVDPAPPFDPTGRTVLSIPTIEDTLPEAEKEDFYRSFNNHFNKAIIVHELFPGHYMQAKIASGNPRQARILFPYEPYTEGWATLVEKIALDAGWDDGDRLTYLAHLRKRMENANRAYTSVQVHCSGWTEEQVLRFSQEEALVAPQFARSLWGRLQRSPMQVTSYFLGADILRGILEAERERLGEDFEVRAFNDAILRAGPVPFEFIAEVVAARRP